MGNNRKDNILIVVNSSLSMIPVSAASKRVCKVLRALGQGSSMRGISLGNRYLFSSSSAPK